MPWNDYSDQRYEATREDVLYAVGPVEPNPLSGPDNPDPFGHNERPWTDYLIACRITERRQLPWPQDHLGRAIKLNKLRELLAEMAADGSIVGLLRSEWIARGREWPSRAGDMLYAHPDLVAKWDQAADVPRETSKDRA